MSDLEPRKSRKREVVAPHIPQVVVPIELANVRDFLREALTRTSFSNPYVQSLTAFAFFEPHVRFSEVDAAHTRIELDVTSRVRGAQVLFFTYRRAEIDRFFIGIQDELDRRARWARPLDVDPPVIETGD